jgi:nitroimidazol reductase NimA-like FMN-containing flavoprotein (pyridoxamine 5'-phosphate oxidase superfamily)
MEIEMAAVRFDLLELAGGMVTTAGRNRDYRLPDHTYRAEQPAFRRQLMSTTDRHSTAFPDLHDIEDLPADHAGAAILPVETCLRLAAREAVGRLAFLADGEIVVLPVNFTLRGSSVCFRSAVGSKVAAAVNHDTVTFEVDRYDLESQTGWSVLLKGTATSVTEEREILALEDTGVEPWLGATSRPYWIRIRPNVVTGRAVIRR